MPRVLWVRGHEGSGAGTEALGRDEVERLQLTHYESLLFELEV